MRAVSLVLAGGALAFAQSANSGAWVGHRYDDAHVLFYFTESTNDVSGTPAAPPSLRPQPATAEGEARSTSSLPNDSPQ
jgi:hypothetical protein